VCRILQDAIRFRDLQELQVYLKRNQHVSLPLAVAVQNAHAHADNPVKSTLKKELEVAASRRCDWTIVVDPRGVEGGHVRSHLHDE
jgi:hypothetical protein